MSSTLEYKGYRANIEIDFEAQEFYGEIEGINDFVNFESEISNGVAGIVKEFHSAVDDYLKFCNDTSKAPSRSTAENEKACYYS